MQYTSEDGAKDIAAFVAIFFEHFSQFKGRSFHMAGESYAVGQTLLLLAHRPHILPLRAATSLSTRRQCTTRMLLSFKQG